MSRDSLSIAPQIYILWIFLCYLLGSLNRGLKTVNPPSLNVEICKLSTVKEFSSESTTIFLNYVADCASKKRQSSKIAYKAVHISYYMTASKGLLSRTQKFTYVPKYKPGISKLDYTNSSLCQIPSRSRYFPPRFELMELTVLSVELLLKGTNRR